jgi:hypothetical protein
MPSSSTARWCIEVHDAEANLLCIADTGREIRGTRAIERDLPDVELVIEQHRLAVLAPPGNAVGGQLVRVVVIGVDEAHLGRSVDCNAACVVEIVRVDLPVLRIQEPAAVGRCAHRARERLLDERPFARCDIHAIVIGLAATPCHFAAIRCVEPANGPPACGWLHGTHAAVGQSQQFLRRQVEHGAVRGTTFLREAYQLL